MIHGTNIPLSVIIDREFLALMLSTTNEEEAEEEAPVAPTPVLEQDPKIVRTRYMHTYGLRATNDLWLQRLGHPSRMTLNNCIEAGVFAPGALLRPNGSEVRTTSQPRNCSVCPEAALSHQPFPLLEPGTKRYPKLHKVYSEFLVVGYCGLNDEGYTLTFVDAGMCYVWVANVQFRSMAFEVFRILHHVSLPYAHPQQGIAEHTNRTLMTKVRVLLKQLKLPSTYWPYAMHHAVRVHNLLSTMPITGNLSPHVKWTGKKGDTSMLSVWGCMVQNQPPTTTIGKFASRARWGIHLDIYTTTSTDLCIIEPKNPRQALTGPHNKEWRKATDAEIKALELHDTWVLFDRAAIKGRRVLSGKWVYRVKTVADRTIECFNAHWVVRGYDQRHGIDFDQTFASVSRHTPVRILLTIAVARHIFLRHIEVKSAFFYALVDAVILLPHDPGMYRLQFCGDYILLTVYLDDLLYTGTKKNLAMRVNITTNHDVKQFLGLNITYAPEAIHLSAAKYAETLEKRFNISPTPLSTPYRTPGPNYKHDNKTLSHAGLHTYQQQLGCLLFVLVTCRPDLSYIASQLSQYSREPTIF
ncbi:unnamed protein product [Closterium sp. NIES-53]